MLERLAMQAQLTGNKCALKSKSTRYKRNIRLCYEEILHHF